MCITQLSEILTEYLVQYSSAMKSFAELFKKYRLRAEFETLSEMGNALADEGLIYEDSIFSHWQKGTRVPNNREILLKLIKIFADRGAIRSAKEANEFLESARQGYLTEKEEELFSFEKSHEAPFQVPSAIAHFTGREKVIEKIQKDLKTNNTFLLYGPPGVGKTALAIELGHLLQKSFPDGVLWYKVDSSNIMDILLSIAQLFGEDISEIKDIEVRASIVRTLLVRKKLLVIFDNVTKNNNLHALLPNSPTCVVILSSREIITNSSVNFNIVTISTFTASESLDLFRKVFDKKFVDKNKSQIMEIAQSLGYLPLALDLFASHIKQFNLKLPEALKLLQNETLDLNTFTYEDKNLFKAIKISFDSLDQNAKEVFISLGIFEGKDFSIEAVSFVNKLTEKETETLMQVLLTKSLVESSSPQRYRIHPMIRAFARKQLIDTILYPRAATYFEQLLSIVDSKDSQNKMLQEVDNVIFVFKKCYEHGYWDQIITLWTPLESYLSKMNEVKKIRVLAEQIDTAPSINNIQKFLTIYLILLIFYWILLFFSGLKTSIWNNIYTLLFSFIPFIGGFVGLLRTKPWGLYSSYISKAKFFISAGLFTWGCGGMLWFFYYNLLEKVDVPYPSLSDLGYFSGTCLWLIGSIYMAKATGTRISFTSIKSKLFWIIGISLIAILVFWIILFMVHQASTFVPSIRIFFDLSYAYIDVVSFILSVIIFIQSINFFRGKYKRALFLIICSFAGMWLIDFIYAYTTSIGIFYNGSIIDLGFTIILYLLTIGILSFYVTPKKIVSNSHKMQIM